MLNMERQIHYNDYFKNASNKTVQLRAKFIEKYNIFLIDDVYIDSCMEYKNV